MEAVGAEALTAHLAGVDLAAELGVPEPAFALRFSFFLYQDEISFRAEPFSQVKVFYF